ncbi:MAG TPA: hypothetical protein VLT87_11750 [Thermoanaerobaculia bacterium]|nr:hypothetical protein [Thermoanaerobaculia bacterium]
MRTSERLEFLNDRIVVRHEELARAVEILSKGSEKLERRGRKLRVTTIILGAFSASQGVTVAALGMSTIATSIVFAISGISVAAIAGIEAAFKFESRASELRMLAAKCQSARFQHNSEWSYRIAIAEPDKAIDAARDLLAIQDRTLAEVQLEAAKLGLNIALGGSRRSRDEADEFTWAKWRADSDFPPPRIKESLPPGGDALPRGGIDEA